MMARRPRAERAGSRVLADDRPLRPAFVGPDSAGDVSTADPVAEARAAGRAEGLESGRLESAARSEAQIAQLRGELTAALRSIAELRERIASECAERMKRLALEAASKMLRARIDAEDPVAARAVREALEALPERVPVTARLNAADLEAVRAELPEPIERGRLALVVDERIARGGCLVESDGGTIDATVPAAEQAVRDAILDRSEAP